MWDHFKLFDCFHFGDFIFIDLVINVLSESVVDGVDTFILRSDCDI